MSDLPKVALLIETSRGYGRGLLRGIVRYARLHGPWRFYLTPGDFAQALPQMHQWGGTGIIARIETAEVARAILAAKLPTIALDVSQSVPLKAPGIAGFSEIASDSKSAAALAAEHLLDRGYKHYAYVGEPDRLWSQNREVGFRERLSQAGHDPLVYVPPRTVADRHWEREQVLLATWLAELPKPVGILACNDDRGRQVLDACRAAGVSVPLEAGVVGVDNDALLCELADPPLSSVALNAETGGYRAAALLDRMMKGRIRKPQRLLVEPTNVVERRSTQASAVDDPDVAAALEFIHHHAADPIGVDDVVNHLEMSRRALELRFRDAVGRTPHDELQRVRLNRAQRLLLETDLPIPKVALAAGYRSGSYLAQVFQKQVGRTPAQYRKDHRT
ncbi:MAG TPA: XylR family transcriptional regulator [Lacipirellulaceae bacterium]|nr:XylR family transcriptional regulator [Lacipirellulaceae bacterium]